MHVRVYPPVWRRQLDDSWETRVCVGSTWSWTVGPWPPTAWCGTLQQHTQHTWQQTKSSVAWQKEGILDFQKNISPTGWSSHPYTAYIYKTFFFFFFNDALNTFYLRLYGVRHMVKDHSDNKRGNPLPPHRLLFPISSKGSFICTIPQTGKHIPRPLLHQSWSTGWNEK